MVFQLVSGLSDAYANVGSQLRHFDTLPPFYKARSMVVLEETVLAKCTQHVTDNYAFMASQENNNPFTPATPHMRTNRPNSNNNSGGRNSRCGFGNNIHG